MVYISIKRKIKQYISKQLKKGRYEHSLRVARTARMLARHYGCSPKDAYLAGLAHDMARSWNKKRLLSFFEEQEIILEDNEIEHPYMLHGRAASILLNKEFDYSNVSVLNALRYHTTGFPSMGDLEKILFLADYLEPGRDHVSSVLRAETKKQSLDTMVIKVIQKMSEYQKKQGGQCHPWTIKLLKELEQRG